MLNDLAWIFGQESLLFLLTDMYNVACVFDSSSG